jgi:hypothetical protein
MHIEPLSDASIVIGKAVDTPGEDDVVGNIATLPELAAFQGKCPLWASILAEATQHQTTIRIPVIEEKSITTPQLGPVGGRIVAEVFLGMMFGDNDSFLTASPNWKPTIGDGSDFTLGAFVQYALGL